MATASSFFVAFYLKQIITVFLLIFQMEYYTCDGLLLKCPLYQMHLQKIVGFRPPLEYLSEHNLLYMPGINHKHRTRFRRDGYTVLPHVKDPTASHLYDGSSPTTSIICWRICNEDDDCIAYVHLLDTNECYGFSYFQRTERYRTIAGELPLVADAEAIFYEKTCLKVPETCKGRLWTLTKIPGTSLVFQGKKTIPTLVTRRECAEKCLFESEFKCLSASFAPSHRNNRERFHYPQQQHHITLGRCILSDKDKMIQPDAFRVARFDEEYIENQCYDRPIENDRCSYELYANSSFIYAEAKYMGLTQKECQQICSHETRFYCQGVSFYFGSDFTQSECTLHSEDLISMGPRSLKLRRNSIYMRRVKCLDVQVMCTHDEMSIKYTPKDWFRGKMYTSMHSKDCVVHGNGTKSIVLRLSIGSEVREMRCGILRAYEMTKEYHRTLISALIVVQNNGNVQTQGDRLIKVGCIISNCTLEHSGNNTINAQDDDEMPSAIALESSLEFTQHVLPNEGSLILNTTTIHIRRQPLPKITLQIIDLSHDHETNDVQIGQNLELQIIAEYSPKQQLSAVELPPLPDFHATSLLAKTQDNQNYVQLIDDRGCPTDVTVFPALERVRTSSKNILRARFHAFKFAGSTMVNFDVKIHFCTNRCAENNCLQYGKTVNDTWRRRRRQVPLEQPNFKVQNPIYISTVMDVPVELNENLATSDFSENTTELELPADLENVLPLNFNLRVRGPDTTNSNSFIYGERGVLLIAGIDDQLHLDNFCVNQSLLIAILIFWLIFQIALMFGCCYLIQKYRRFSELDDRKTTESLEYLESRRVHWADQGGYTL